MQQEVAPGLQAEEEGMPSRQEERAEIEDGLRFQLHCTSLASLVHQRVEREKRRAVVPLEEHLGASVAFLVTNQASSQTVAASPSMEASARSARGRSEAAVEKVDREAQASRHLGR